MDYKQTYERLIDKAQSRERGDHPLKESDIFIINREFNELSDQAIERIFAIPSDIMPKGIKLTCREYYIAIRLLKKLHPDVSSIDLLHDEIASVMDFSNLSHNEYKITSREFESICGENGEARKEELIRSKRNKFLSKHRRTNLDKCTPIMSQIKRFTTINMDGTLSSVAY